MPEHTERPSRAIPLAIPLLAAAIIYLSSILSPPSLMDDVDAVQAQIARTMLSSGDWVTARIDGVDYFEKSPLVYWLIAFSYKLFGIHDWAARIPIALSAIALAWLTAAFGIWAFGKRAGRLSGLVIATCIGLWLFTRILIPDVMLTFTVALALWAFLRALNEDDSEPHPHAWAYVLYIALAAGFLLKSLVGVVFPLAACFLYLAFTRRLFTSAVWGRLHIVSGTTLFLLLTAPWHVLATIRNPPYFAATLTSAPGHYHGFLWFYFINEQLLRFLNLRFPRDYDTVPRIWFWLFHFAWLFPWSVYLPAVAKLSFKPADRAGRTRLLALCCIGFVLIFFTFSTTQEYYSMPCYPALALLLGSAMAEEGRWIRGGTRALSLVAAIAAVACFAILITIRHVPTPGDITAALARHPNAYKLSLGHMEDLTLPSFAYLRLPLLLAGAAFFIGVLGTLRTAGEGACRRAYLAAALMMIVFFQAARLAMVRFDPLLSSRDLAQLILASPPGETIVDHHYYWFSSIPFYTGRSELLLNGRWYNLEYGSNAPGTPNVFLDDQKLHEIWTGSARLYLIARAEQLPRLTALMGEGNTHILRASGGKLLITNHPLAINASAGTR